MKAAVDARFSTDRQPEGPCCECAGPLHVALFPCEPRGSPASEWAEWLTLCAQISANRLTYGRARDTYTLELPPQFMRAYHESRSVGARYLSTSRLCIRTGVADRTSDRCATCGPDRVPGPWSCVADEIGYFFQLKSDFESER